MKTIKVNEIRNGNLIRKIKDYISFEYSGFIIKKVYRVCQKKEITYDVNIVKGAETHILIFDKYGSFLEETAPKINRMMKLVGAPSGDGIRYHFII
ncbi:MAG: hypothetical protein U0W24_17655 [Bacteroidales bacterium]